MPRPATDPAKAAQIKVLRQQAGRWLKTAREQAGLTQAELAEKVGLRYYTFVSQVESGLGRLPIETQGAWAEALGLEPGDFAKDGTHHSPNGQDKLGRLLIEFFRSDVTTRPWFVAR